jgi:hypothetical protein
VTILNIRLALLRLFACAALAAPGAAAAQADGADRPPPVSVGMELGLAALDGRHAINAAPLFLTPGVELRTRGRVFVFAGARAMVFAIPISGDGGDRVQDADGNHGRRRTGELGGGGWFRVGAGASLADLPRAPTVSVAVGSVGMGPDAHLWVGGAAGIALRGRWRVEAELGWDRNWVEDTFFHPPPTGPAEPFIPGPLYTRRSDVWLRTMQVGMRYRM